MIDKKQVEHIAKLARIGISEEEKEKFAKDLSGLLDYFEILKEVNTENIEPLNHSIKIENVMRADESESESEDCVQRLIDAAPDKKERHIKVRAVF